MTVRRNMGMDPGNNAWRTTLLLLPFAGYALLVSLFFNEMPMHEEVIHLRDTGSWKTALGYSCHPPLYVLLGRAIRSATGGGYRSLYLLGAGAALVNLALIGMTLSTLAHEEGYGRRFKTAAAGLWMTASMPAFVHGSLLLEMEPVVLTPLALLALLYYLRNKGARMDSRKASISGVLFGLAMWAKYFFTPFLLMGSIFIYEILTGHGFFAAFKKNAIRLFTALAVFLPAYELYSYLFIKGPNSISFLAHDKTAEGAPLFASGKIFFAIGTKVMALTFWFSPFFVALFIYLSCRMAKRWRELGQERLLLPSILSIFLFYLLLHPYPFAELKYFYPMFPLMAVMTVKMLDEEEVWLPPAAYLIIIAGVAAAAMFYTLGDPFQEVLSLYREQQVQRLWTYAAEYAAFNIAAFAGTGLIVSRLVYRRRDALLCALLILGLSSNVSLFMHQAIGGYQTRVQYGEIGADKTIEFAKKRISKESSVIIPNDIAFYTGVSFEKHLELSGLLKNQDWEWIIDRRANILRLSPEKKALLDGYVLERQIGSYMVYRKKNMGSDGAGNHISGGRPLLHG